jgi:phosphomannomutase
MRTLHTQHARPRWHASRAALPACLSLSVPLSAMMPTVSEVRQARVHSTRRVILLRISTAGGAGHVLESPSMTIAPDLQKRAQAWIDDDPDRDAQAELRALLESGAEAELTDRMSQRLEFGTAGLRGVIGAGPNRMNLKVVREATAGLCAYLLETTKDAAERGITIGYDGRRMSRELSREAAEIALAAGLRVAMFEYVTPTPVLAFAATERNAAAAIMVTASHNPPEYNGYKVYWGNGAQIIPPHDVGIAAAIEKVGPALALKKVAIESAKDRFVWLGKAESDRYHAAIRKLPPAGPRGPRDLVITYTALHGVGDQPTRRALAEAGFTNVHSVAEQAEPDGAFPTVRFPNPEEKGAMDLVLALAKKVSAELVIANDPDADRLAIAVPRPDGTYRQLTGNEVGCLLAHYLLGAEGPSGKRMVLSSIVSSPMLGSIAKEHGAYWEETLTGFKWIANRAMELEPSGYRFVMGYEEALGYTVGDLVRDKDGVSAALVFAELASSVKARGGSIEDELDVMARRYGLYLSRQVSVTMKGADGAKDIAAIMDGVRRAPPTQLGKHAVTAILDLARGEKTVNGKVEKLALPPSNAIALELEGGHRVMLRPSGTEPKIKYYFDVREQVAPKEHTSSARARGEETVSALVAAFTAMLEAKR